MGIDPLAIAGEQRRLLPNRLLLVEAGLARVEQRFARDLYGAFSVKRLFWVCDQFFVRSGKAVLRPVACDQVRGARGRGQGTETLAELGGLPPSVACVSQRLEA